MRRHLSGVTLIELVVTVSLMAIVSIAIVATSMQSMRLYARFRPLIMGDAPGRSAPQSAMMVGIKRMDREIREALFIRVGSADTAVEIALPKLDAHGDILVENVIVDQVKQRKALMSFEGMHVCFFLGRRDTANPQVAIPDAVNGDTIFRIASGTPTTTGTDIISSGGTLDSSYANATEVISGITKVAYLFSYHNGSDNSSFESGMNARVVRINLTYPVVIPTRAGRIKENQTLTTEFCLRNFETL